MSNEYLAVLEEIYKKAEVLLSNNDNLINSPNDLDPSVISNMDIVANKVEDYLGINNVLTTSLLEKTVNPSQDIRKHQAKMEGGYSGRTIDTKYVAPFLKSKKLKSMVESGWLTRSLEQGYPYNLNYRGAIRNTKVKNAFLKILDAVQNSGAKPYDCLLYYFQCLILLREKGRVKIVPLEEISNSSIDEICDKLHAHFTSSRGQGRAKLPVIAVHSIYECLLSDLKRFRGKKLIPLGSHTSADLRSKAIGDIQVNDEDGKPYEGVEIKYDKQITCQIVEDSFEKIKTLPVNRYYILSTKKVRDEDFVDLQKSIHKIATEHGCQIIVNGLIQTIKYYLRLIDKPEKFIDIYTNNIIKDSELKLQQKNAWKTILETSNK